jgi:hypothetical protein
VECNGRFEANTQEVLRFDGRRLWCPRFPWWPPVEYTVDTRADPWRITFHGLPSRRTIWKVEGDRLYLRYSAHGDDPQWPTTFDTRGDPDGALYIYRRVPGARR